MMLAFMAQSAPPDSAEMSHAPCEKKNRSNETNDSHKNVRLNVCVGTLYDDRLCEVKPADGSA
jgi:hypothetical protein